MKLIRQSFILFAGISIMTSCGTSKNEKKDISSSSLYTINTDYLDRSTSPQEDFFQFANGTWITNNPVPPSESRWGSFNELDKRNKAKLTKILNEALEADAPKGSNLQIIGDYYAAKKDVKRRNEQSPKKIIQINETLKHFTDKSFIPKAVHMMKLDGITAFANLYVSQDLKNVDKNTLYLSQGGLGL